MAFMEYNEKDMKRSIIVTPSWYRVKITACDEKLSQKGDSTNWMMEATIIKHADNDGEEFAGVPVMWNFNSKAAGLSVGFVTSCGGDISAGSRFRMQDTVGKEVEMNVITGAYNNIPKNDTNYQFRKVRELRMAS